MRTRDPLEFVFGEDFGVGHQQQGSLKVKLAKENTSRSLLSAIDQVCGRIENRIATLAHGVLIFVNILARRPRISSIFGCHCLYYLCF